LLIEGNNQDGDWGGINPFAQKRKEMGTFSTTAVSTGEERRKKRRKFTSVSGGAGIVPGWTIKLSKFEKESQLPIWVGCGKT